MRKRSRPLWIPRSSSPSEGRRSSWSIWPSRMRVSVWSRSSISLKNPWKRPKVPLKILENSCKFQLLCALSPLTTPTSWGPVRFSHGGLCQWEAKQKDYRKYKIKTVVGPDDYASMREVIRRRYSRVMRDGPDAT